MKKTYIVTFIFLGLCSYIALNSFILKTAGMHPSSTGAPGELTCANAQTGCHSDANVTNDNSNIVNTFAYSAADSSYIPNQTYTIILKAKKAGIAKFGFGMVALQNSNTSNMGTWVVTDVARTHTITGTGSLSSRKYITHSTNGTPAFSAGLGQWSFQWTAPSSNVGNITFYYATNCTNNNNKSLGDQLFLSSFQIHPSKGTSITEFINEENFKAVLNPVSHQLILHYSLIKDCEIAINLFDALGKEIKNINPTMKTMGEYSDTIDLSKETATGMYFVNVNINNQILTKKIMVQ